MRHYVEQPAVLPAGVQRRRRHGARGLPPLRGQRHRGVLLLRRAEQRTFGQRRSVHAADAGLEHRRPVVQGLLQRLHPLRGPDLRLGGRHHHRQHFHARVPGPADEAGGAHLARQRAGVTHGQDFPLQLRDDGRDRAYRIRQLRAHSLLLAPAAHICGPLRRLYTGLVRQHRFLSDDHVYYSIVLIFGVQFVHVHHRQASSALLPPRGSKVQENFRICLR